MTTRRAFVRHVAGVAALLISQGVKEPDAVKAALQKAARPQGPKNQYGAGLLDAAAAVGRGQALQVQRPMGSVLTLFTIITTPMRSRPAW